MSDKRRILDPGGEEAETSPLHRRRGQFHRPGVGPAREEAEPPAAQLRGGRLRDRAPGASVVAPEGSAPLTHPTARPHRQAEVLRLQRTAGNRYVARLMLQRQGSGIPPAAAAGPEAAPGPALIVEDSTEALQPGQMKKGEFLAQLRAAVTGAAEAALAGTGRSVRDCPYIEPAFAYYNSRDSGHLERALRKYAPEVAGARAAQAYVAAVAERVGRSVSTWARTGEVAGVPEELPPGLPAAGLLGGLTQAATAADGPTAAPSGEGEGGSGSGEAPEGSSVQAKGRDGGAREAADPRRVQSELGPGQALPGPVRSQMEAALGEGLGDVRVHTDSTAARLSSNLNARAFTVGRDVAFGAGEYQPGSPVGDALIAHELAHVVQQRSAGEPTGVQRLGEGAESALEADADVAAGGAVAALWGGVAGGLSGLARGVMPALRSGLRLQRCSTNAPPSASTTAAPTASATAPALPTARGPDQHAGATAPDAARQASILRELNPTSTSPTGVALLWDGRAGAPGAAARRAALKRELAAALAAHLRRAMPGINRVAGARRLPMTSFEGAGTAAKRVVDARFGSLGAAAAFTPGQAAARAAFAFRGSGPSQTLFDAYDPAQRAATGHPIDPDDLASWMAETDATAQRVQSAHHFNPNRAPGGEEELFLRTEVLAPFVAAHRADLEKYDQFGFAISGDRIVAPSSVALGMSDTPGPGGEPSPAERAARWGAWKLLVHEYLHTLAHPAFNSAARGNRIMVEGFCELFTKEVLLAELPGAPSNPALVRDVEGGVYSPPTAAIVGGYSPGDYAAYLAHAENIRDRAIGGGGGQSAVKAAFFQGHVEFLGLTPAGRAAAPAAGGPNAVRVPAGISTVTALATAAGVPEADILSANPGLTAAGPLPPSVIVPGCREHTVVEATDARFSRSAETRTQIAAQNGVSEADLARANPSANWTALSTGDVVLIPKH